MSELERVQRDIATLLESNRLVWMEFGKEIDPKKRIALKKEFYDRADELWPLFEKLDQLRNEGRDT